MDVMDGVTSVRKLRALEAEEHSLAIADPSRRTIPRTRVICVTGNARQGQQDAALEAGMDSVFIKPYKLIELLKKVEEGVVQQGRTIYDVRMSDQVIDGTTHPFTSRRRELS